jgi:hypothetical protein
VGLVTGAGGVLLVGGGIYAALRSASLAQQLSQLSSQQGTWTPQAQSNYDSGKTFATVANVLYATGAAALATGITLTLLGWPSSPSAPSTMGSLAPLPHGVSVSLTAVY